MSQAELQLTDIRNSLVAMNNRMSSMEATWNEVKGKGAFAQQQAPQAPTSSVPYEEFSLRSIMPTKADFPMIAAGFGSASSGAVAGFLTRFIPAEGFFGIDATTLAQLVGGWLIYKFGSRWSQYISAFGGGVLINAIGRAFETYGFSLGKFTGGLGLGAGAGGDAVAAGGIAQP